MTPEEADALMPMAQVRYGDRIMRVWSYDRATGKLWLGELDGIVSLEATEQKRQEGALEDVDPSQEFGVVVLDRPTVKVYLPDVAILESV